MKSRIRKNERREIRKEGKEVGRERGTCTCRIRKRDGGKEVKEEGGKEGE